MRRTASCWLLSALAVVLADSLPAQLRFRLVGLDQGRSFGQRFELRVERAWPARHNPQPFDDAALLPLDVRLLEAKVRLEDGMLVERRRYEALALRTGEVALGPFEVRTVDEAGRAHLEVFEVPPLQVRSTLPDPIGEVEWPGDVRDRAEPARGGLWALLLAVPLAAALVWLRFRRSPPAAAKLLPPGPTPAESARAELEALEVESQGAVAALAFHTEVVAILRRFASRSFGLRAEVHTSEQLVAALEHGTAPLGRCLLTCDFVKFAASASTLESSAACIRAALEFVAATEGPS